MGRERRTGHSILTACIILLICGCSETGDMTDSDYSRIHLFLDCPGYETKALLPEDDAVNDLNIIFFEEGMVEESIWAERICGPEDLEFEVSLVRGKTYSVAAIANMGKRLFPKSQEEFEETIFELQTSDRFPDGIPMSAYIEGIVPDKETHIRMELIRMAAKISIRIDRSRLSDDVQMNIRNVRIGNYPRFVSVAEPSKAISRHDVFEEGFELTTDQCRRLNDIGHQGLSGEVSLYMLENMQGERFHEAEDGFSETASFIEMEVDYKSGELISYDSPLIYRFYLGDGPENLDVERNSHYHITILPEDDGLSGSGWRVDKSGIGPATPTFRLLPGDYVEGHVGDTVRVWCECYPRTSPFDPGTEELNYDKSRGIYDYKIDDDRHGVTLYLKNPGTGIVYMSAGEPINRSGMVLIRVNP